MDNKYLSIAMCTYNGSNYLMEQLESFAKQTRLPGELVVVDDNSTDNTTQIINVFANKAKFPVHLTINETRLGPAKNFEKAIGLCNGNIIALSDQDDVWRPEKLQRIESVFSQFPRVGALFSDAEIVNENLEPLGYSLWKSMGFTKSLQRRAENGHLFKVLLNHNVATGATMAFRSQYKKWLLPIPPIWMHDGWIAIIIAVLTEVAIVKEPFIQYRQHSVNVIGGRKRFLRERFENAKKTTAQTFLAEAEKYQKVYEKLSTISNCPHIEKLDPLIRQKIIHFHNRAKMDGHNVRRYLLAFHELIKLRYYNYSRGWQSFLRDILIN